MPSRADDSFLRLEWRAPEDPDDGCQCPLELMTHFYMLDRVYYEDEFNLSVNALSS